MKPVNEVTACVVDHGMYLGVAVELAKVCKRVLYENRAAVDAYPVIDKCTVGDGFEDVEVITLPEDHWEYKSEIDLYVFPDIYHGGEQRELAAQGKAVWGSREGDRDEVLRGKFLKRLAERKLEVPPHRVIEGLTALRVELSGRENVYVKISRYRGTMETFHWRDWDHDEGWLDKMAVAMGPQKEEVTFYVFDAIETEIEVGLDTYLIDGACPGTVLVGYEWKDKGYFGAVTPWASVPGPLVEVKEAFAPELAACQYRNFLSSEVRVKGDRFWFIDPTRRMPSPGGASQLKLYENLGEIIWRGASGELVEPVMRGRFACECAVTAKGARDAWKALRLDGEIAESFVGWGCSLVNGVLAWAPAEDTTRGEELGYLVNVADTPGECIRGMLDKAKALPDDVSAATESLADLLKEVESGKEQGVPFTKQSLPEPAEVVEHE